MATWTGIDTHVRSEFGDRPGRGGARADRLRKAWIGDDEFDVLVGTDPGRAGTQPLVVLVTPWIVEHLALYARRLWSQR
jgi:hypothetical protein